MNVNHTRIALKKYQPLREVIQIKRLSYENHRTLNIT